MRRLSILAACLALPACFADDRMHPATNDGGATPPYIQLDQASATLTLADDASSSTVLILLHGSDGTPVVLQSGQSVSANGSPLGGGQGNYSATLPVADSLAIKVDEPRHGVLTTTYDLPVAFQITNASSFDLAGDTLTWSPIEPGDSVAIHLTQDANGVGKSADFTESEDTGSRHFTDLELKDYVQGYPLEITVTRSRPGAALQGVASSQVTLSRARTAELTPTSSP